MVVWVLLVIVGAIFVLIGVAIAWEGIARTQPGRQGIEAAAAPKKGIIQIVVEWLLEKFSLLIDSTLKGSLTALGLILLLVGALCIAGGIYGESKTSNSNGVTSTTSSVPGATTTTTQR